MLENLICDRSSTDIKNKTTKGYYNYNDLNRIECWCGFVSSVLNKYFYYTTITIKTNWTRKDFLTVLKAKSQILHFTEDNTLDLLPIMKTDITLEYAEKTLVIDAKFYSHILSNSPYGSRVVSSGNLYQVLAYVDNLDPYKENKVCGMLLYAQTISEPTISINMMMNKHMMHIRTIDLNEEWSKIKETLDDIASDFMNGLYI